MKIVVQNLKTGKVSLADAPKPAVPDNGILVRTSASLISAGTDRAVVGLARKSTVGKALARPDLVRRVLRKVKNDGLWAAYKAVQNGFAEQKTLPSATGSRAPAPGTPITPRSPPSLPTCSCRCPRASPTRTPPT